MYKSVSVSVSARTEKQYVFLFDEVVCLLVKSSDANERINMHLYFIFNTQSLLRFLAVKWYIAKNGKCSCFL